MNYYYINPYYGYSKYDEEGRIIPDDEVFEKPVIDRTKFDVQKVLDLYKKKYDDFSVDEKREWLKGLKGAINYNDLYRVQIDIQTMSDILELNLTVVDVPTIPTVEFLNGVLENVSTIMENAVVHATTPKVPNTPLNTYSKWNDLETILIDVYDILYNNFYHYIGENFMCGDEIGLLL